MSVFDWFPISINKNHLMDTHFYQLTTPGKENRKKKVHQKNLRWSLPPRNLKVVTGSSTEAGTWRLIATYRYFASASRLICILFAGFPSIVYSPSVCHSRLLKVEQTPNQEPCVTLRNNIEYKGSYPLNKKIIRK